MNRRNRAAVALIVVSAVFIGAGIVTGRIVSLIAGIACALVVLALAV